MTNASQAWHISPVSNRASIESSGLRASDEGLWLWSELSRACAGTTFDVWEIDLAGLTVSPGHLASMEWYEGDPVLVTYNDVPPAALRRQANRVIA